jgi:hypothetical protein
MEAHGSLTILSLKTATETRQSHPLDDSTLHLLRLTVGCIIVGVSVVNWHYLETVRRCIALRLGSKAKVNTNMRQNQCLSLIHI